MRRFTLIFTTICLSSIVLAQVPIGVEKPRKELTVAERAERMAKRDRAIMRLKGGIVSKPGSQIGTIIFVNAQKKIGLDVVTSVATRYVKALKLNVQVRDGVSVPDDISKLDDEVMKYKAQAALFIVDSQKYPTLLSAPENRWVVLNVSSLVDCTDDNKTTRRFHLELIRAFALLAGGAESQYPNSVMRSVSRPEDLDAISIDQFPLDVTQRIENRLRDLGVTPLYITTYRHAVQEGWAPLPTNDYQKAIWERVKADRERGPTKPITIPPPTKK